MATRDALSGRRPVSATEAIHRGALRVSAEKARKKLERMSPDLNWGLGVARVVNIDYEEYFVTLKTVMGASQTHERVPVPMTFPGAGARHFFGAMPEVGDTCIVGWMPQESSEKGGGTKTPVILAWVLPGVWPGRDWAKTGGYEIDEYDTTNPRAQSMISGAHDVIRHKLRHIQPGNIVASSSQGSDLVLDEGVMLSNRRGNELRLRDQDQAFIVRSLQQFHAMAGARIYAGMVQRDATFLPPSMISDGNEWDAIGQSQDGMPLTENDLGADTSAPKGFLKPAKALAKSRTADGNGRATLVTGANLDPYKFLTRGSFIRDSGFAGDNRHESDAIYGGKPIFRVSAKNDLNATLHPKAPTLTEYRIEVTHTSDGLLPVTEQTDMFDAERLPGGNPASKTGLKPINVPFIEHVLGSVVGNDPFSQEGRKKYGIPLVAKVFEGDLIVPRLDGAILGFGSEDGDAATDMGDHLAMLFRMVPPLQTVDSAGTFWAVNKQGQFKASIGGDPKQFSAEIAMAGSMKIGLGGGMRFISDGHLEWVTRSKSSLHMKAEEGAVFIYGGGAPKTNSSVIERESGTGDGEGDLPSVDILAKTNAHFRANKQIMLKSATLVANATSVQVTGNEELALAGVRKLSLVTENFQKVVSSQAQESYTGPKYLMSTNFPLHDRTYSPMTYGLAERVTYNMGDREETFKLGSHKTSILVGSMTYETEAGTWTARAVQSRLDMGTFGITGVAPAGTVTLTAASGTATMSGFAGATLVATGGLATVRGSAGVYLGAPVTGPDFGPIVCAGSLEPFTGLPFATWGIGAKNHIVGI